MREIAAAALRNWLAPGTSTGTNGLIFFRTISFARYNQPDPFSPTAFGPVLEQLSVSERARGAGVFGIRRGALCAGMGVREPHPIHPLPLCARPLRPVCAPLCARPLRMGVGVGGTRHGGGGGGGGCIHMNQVRF